MDWVVGAVKGSSTGRVLSVVEVEEKQWDYVSCFLII